MTTSEWRWLGGLALAVVLGAFLPDWVAIPPEWWPWEPYSFRLPTYPLLGRIFVWAGWAFLAFFPLFALWRGCRLWWMADHDTRLGYVIVLVLCGLLALPGALKTLCDVWPGLGYALGVFPRCINWSWL